MNVEREIEQLIATAPAEIAAISSAEQFNAFVGKLDKVAATALNDAQVAKLNPYLRSAEAHRQLTRLRLEALRHIGKQIFEGARIGIDDQVAGRALSLAQLDEKAFEIEVQQKSEV